MYRHVLQRLHNLRNLDDNESSIALMHLPFSENNIRNTQHHHYHHHYQQRQQQQQQQQLPILSTALLQMQSLSIINIGTHHDPAIQPLRPNGVVLEKEE